MKNPMMEGYGTDDKIRYGTGSSDPTNIVALDAETD